MSDKDAYIKLLEEQVCALKEIIKLLPGHVYWKDKNSVFLGSNEKHAKHFGFKSAEELIKLTTKDLVSKELSLEEQERDAAAIIAVDKAVMNSDKSLILEEVENLVNTKNYYLSIKAPLHDKEGNVTGIVGISIDITKQKVAEERERIALAEAAAAKENAKAANELHVLASILDMIPGHVYWKDKNLIIRGCNEPQAKRFGFKSPKEMIGLHHRDLVSKELSPKEQEREIADVVVADKAVMNSNKSMILEEVEYSPHGNIYYLSIKAPLHDKKGNVIGIAGVSIDITKQKEAELREREAFAEAAMAKEHAKAEAELREAVMVLAGSIAHDMRTPLAIIRLLGEVLNNNLMPLIHAYEIAKQANLTHVPDINPRQLKKLPEIPKNLADTVTDMNDYINITLKSLSQVLAQELKPKDLERCSADYVISKAISSFPFEPGERELVHIDSTYQFDFMGNQILAFRLLANLIKNALYQIKQKNKGEIFISTCDAGDYNQIIVKDTAGGISAEAAAHLFDGYQTTKKGGTGVGLAFCKLTMESFQGLIFCSSVEGDYIEFILSFPKLA